LFSSTINGGGRYTLARVNKDTMNGGGGEGRSRTSGGGEREKARVNFL